ncbi:MAG: DUF1552 domain-containing protein [Myxococcales bacterium]|nr:DUF1552 domain-containing protein [Myxococcales bacterium]
MKTPSRFAISRRTLLRGSLGIGVASVGLPLLEIMLNDNGTALAGGAALPKQLIIWFMGNGFRVERFEPTTVGADYAATEELQPFFDAGLDPYMKVVTGLQNWCYKQFTHHEGMTAFSGYNPAEVIEDQLFSKSGGPTIDQVIAQHIQDTAPSPPLIRSIQAGISPRTSSMDSGTTMYAVSHRSTNEPLNPEFSPHQVWQTLFGEFQPKPDDSEHRLSVVDAVREDAKKLRAKLGKVDQERLDAHIDGLNELEQLISATPPSCDAPADPVETNPVSGSDGRLVLVNELMSQLIVHAMKCDITRVASVMFIGGAADTNYNEIGQNSTHHMNTHNGSSNAQNNLVHPGVVFAMEQAAVLGKKLRDEVDPTGKSLLESGCMLIGSDCSVGLTHSVSRQPYILLGTARDALKGKYHHQGIARSGGDGNLAANGNTSDVLLTVLKAYNPAATSVGDLTPANLEGGWYGTGNPPGQMAPGSSTIVDALTGPEFGT